VRCPAILLLTLLLAPLAEAQSHAGAGRVERHVETVYYDVEGATVEEIAQGLRQRGPLTAGERFFARTEWTINAEYVWAERDTGCTVEDPVVRVAITITMPRWRAPRGAPPELQGAWNRFERALEGHEQNHARLATEAAEAVRWELATLRFPHCTNAETRARQRVAAIIETYNERNRLYDRQTQHGVTEGAVWPPRRRIGADVGRR
jgi:predicted secreted Zn-dependent protease